MLKILQAFPRTKLAILKDVVALICHKSATPCSIPSL